MRRAFHSLRELYAPGDPSVNEIVVPDRLEYRWRNIAISPTIPIVDHSETGSGFRAASKWRAVWDWCRWKVQWESATLGSHHQTGEFVVALSVGRSGPSHGTESVGVAQPVLPPGDAAGTENGESGDGTPLAIRLYWMWREGHDYDASLGWNGTSSAREKRRSCLSACRSVIEKRLTPPTLSETPNYNKIRFALVPDPPCLFAARVATVERPSKLDERRVVRPIRSA